MLLCFCALHFVALFVILSLFELSWAASAMEYFFLAPRLLSTFDMHIYIFSRKINSAAAADDSLAVTRILLTNKVTNKL